MQVACSADDVPDSHEVQTWIQAALEGADSEIDEVELVVRIVDSAEMQALNAEYRGQDKPTNVLSFPTGDVSALPPDAPRPIGDIVICADVVAAEAGAQAKLPAHHWAHMLVHGTLHLLGYDHEHDDDARVMEALETQILAARGITNPYA